MQCNTLFETYKSIDCIRQRSRSSLRKSLQSDAATVTSNGSKRKWRTNSKYVIRFDSKLYTYLSKKLANKNSSDSAMRYGHKIKTPDLPNKAWTRQISFSKDSMFDEEFLKSRCELLEIFINK